MFSRLRLPGARSLRARLTAWYVILLGLTLLLFCGYLYLRMAAGLVAQVDSGLQAVASENTVESEPENTHPTLANKPKPGALFGPSSNDDVAVRLIAADGALWDSLGNISPLPAWVPRTQGYATISAGNGNWRFYSLPIFQDGQAIGWLQTAQALAPVENTLGELRLQLMLGLPLILLVAGGSGFFLARRALGPIDRITRTAQAIGAEDLAQRIAYQGPNDEVGRLAGTFDRMLDRLQTAFARERRFTADASHELRTPLAALKGRIGMTLSRPRSPEEYESTLRDAEQQVDRLVRLSNDLLLLSRLDEGRLALHADTLDLSGLLLTASEQLRPLAEAKQLVVRESIADGIHVQGHPDHLIRLFLNLLDNAIKYTPAGGYVTIHARADGTSAWVAISDTGPGIPPEHLPRLFERFHRVESARTRDGGGAGLGLAIAYETARWHGGTLEAHSEPGAGSTFTVCLPIYQQRERVARAS